MLKNYISSIFRTFSEGDATENSYYLHIKLLIEEFSKLNRNKEIVVTILPKQTEAGNPDFRIWDGKQKITGYIEAKDIGTDLDRIENSEQLKRYFDTFPNVILTNYTEFRLYRDGQLIDKVSITRHYLLKTLSTKPILENGDKLFELLQRFLDFSLPKTFSAMSLATELAKRTKFLKDVVVIDELNKGTESVNKFYEAFKEYLIEGLTKEEFADIYSQTITYGLFAARLRAKEDFNRRLAYHYIPKSIGILREIFSFISLNNIPDQMEAIIDDISEVLAVSDTKKILDEYYYSGKGSDPILHFYEIFLSVYDPKTRERRGVYYTPEPAVSFIVHSLHQILKDKFNISEGLASKKVTILDPAGGTLCFITKAVEIAVEEIKTKYGEGVVKSFLRDQVLKNFYAFELMMAPYAIGHIKMSFLIEELGYTLQDDERIKYYLTNTLDMSELEQSKFQGVSSLSQENHEAGKVKKHIPILVVMGNPPYSGHSSNTGDWISREIQDYFKVDGKPLGEKNPKWLQDDYVKFIRFAHWKIDQTGEGVLGFITNHSYLDNPTFRGMRQSLMTSFDEIYILDLHGNSLKKEKAIDGSKDENVFDIQQGVAIAFFIKYKNRKTKSVFHHELFGLREQKYDWLKNHDIRNTEWNELKPNKDFYLFIPQDITYQKEYHDFIKITEIFPVNGVGITTARDEFVIDHDKNALINRIRLFKNSKFDDENLHTFFNIRKKDGWDIRKALNMLQDLSTEQFEKLFVDIYYRPFDKQTIFYHDSLVWRTVKRIMGHLLKENLAILVCRQQKTKGFFHAFISENITESSVVSNNTSEISSTLPLYLYPVTSKKDLFVTNEQGAKTPNIKPELFEKLKVNFGKEVTPEEIFYYIYAVLYSPNYRTKYAEFLKIDFPGIPFTKDYDQFIELGKLGKRLADLHLLKSSELDNIIAKFPISGNNQVERLKYENEKVWINTGQYFNNVKEEIWKYQIGGYQVCDKWLKDRKTRILTSEEIKTYCKIVTALGKTIEIQREIDEMKLMVNG